MSIKLSTKQKTRLRQFLLAYITTLTVFSIIYLFISSIFNQMSWGEIFARIHESWKPVVYLLAFSFFASLAIMIYLYYLEKKQFKKVERALRLLAQGQYSADMFLKMFADHDDPQISAPIDSLLLLLHERLLLMAEEVVAANQQSSQMHSETKEEILEQERHRIARELHDSVSQQLFAASMMLSAVNERADQLPEMYANQLAMIEKIIKESQSEMRAHLLHLRPIKLEGKTLKEGIEQLLTELNTKVPLKMTYDVEDVHLSPVIENHLFRIVQELLSNVLRHAHASELYVYLNHTAGTIQLRVVDDGIGFDTTQKKTGSYGFLNTRERIETLGGSVRIVSFPGQGTSIELTLPNITGG